MRHISKYLLILTLFTASAVEAAEPVGQVVDLVDIAWVSRGGAKIPLAFEQEIFLGDVVSTNTTGAVKILFTDSTLLTVKEKSSVAITEFLFDANAGKRNVVFQVTLGTIRAVVGKFFGKDEPVTIKTPTAVAGIRGTDLGAVAEQLATTFYCFDCSTKALEIYNIEFPEEIVNLTTNQSIKILARRAADRKEIVPIPEDILKYRESIFDITLEAKSASGATAERASQKAAGEGTALERAAGTTTGGGDDLIEAGLLNKFEEGNLLGNSQGTVDNNWKINPGGTNENSTRTTIQITFP